MSSAIPNNVGAGSLRLFVALDLPETVRASLSSLCAELQKVCPGARWVGSHNSHLTLKFIGSVPSALAGPIREALVSVPNEVTLGIPAVTEYDLRFTGLGFFPDARRPRVLWAGIQSGAALGRIVTMIETALEPLGIPRESRDFRPHITLARFYKEAALAPLRAAVAARSSAAFGTGRVESFHLYQSILKSTGAEYTRLASYPFFGEQAP